MDNKPHSLESHPMRDILTADEFRDLSRQVQYCEVSWPVCVQVEQANERIGLSQSEVAELLGITPGRVGQIERMAMEKIRTLIETESRRAGCSAHEWMGV
jgi:hypothetical protein